MSKFIAFAFASAASAATVSIHEHFGTKDPDTMLESMRALAKQAVEGKIPESTFEVVEGFVASITSHLMTSMEECVQVEERYVTSIRQTLTGLNTQLSNDIADVATAEEENRGFIDDTVVPGRAQERGADADRCDLCGELCNDLSHYTKCGGFPTSGPSEEWLNDAEPCCDRQTDQIDVPAEMRSQQWRDLETFMECLDTFVTPGDSSASAMELFENYQGECINASETWENKKEQIDPSDGSVANDLCTMIQNDEDKCTYYYTNFNAQDANHSGKIGIAQEIVENTYQQYEALRKIQCLFDAIKLATADVAGACAACEAEPAVCTGMCSDDPDCPDDLKCATCCLPPIPESVCDQRHKCDVCTGHFRHEFYDCPAAEYNNTEALCEEKDGIIVDKATSLPPAPQWQLLIAQLGCTGFSCEDICDGLNEDGYIAAYGTMPRRRAYEPFTCGGESMGNWNFDE